MALTPTGTLINTFDTEWVGVLQEQTPKFLAGFVDETIRRRILLAMLRKNGRIMLGAGGPMCVWSVKFAQPPIQSVGDAGGYTFDRHQLMRQAALNWRGYYGSDLLTEKEFLMNKGPGQIFERYGQIIPSLMESLTDKFGGELFIDGEASGNENRIHGIESFLGAGTVTSVDLVAAPSDTYAGLSTVPGSETGSWSTTLASGSRPNQSLANDWPHGTGSVSYDFNSPKLLNWSASTWGTGATTWESNCERVLRQAKIWLSNLGGQSGQKLICLMSADLYNGFLNHMGSKFRGVIPHQESNDLGFSDAMNFEGMSVMFDYEVPAGTFYIFDVRMMEMASLDNVLFGYRGPEYYMPQGSWLFKVGFWGNGRYRAKHFAKGKAYA